MASTHDKCGGSPYPGHRYRGASTPAAVGPSNNLTSCLSKSSSVSYNASRPSASLPVDSGGTASSITPAHSHLQSCTASETQGVPSSTLAAWIGVSSCRHSQGSNAPKQHNRNHPIRTSPKLPDTCLQRHSSLPRTIAPLAGPAASPAQWCSLSSGWAERRSAPPQTAQHIKSESSETTGSK